MSIASVLLVLVLACVAWGVVVSIMIFASLRRRGEKVGFLFLRFMLPFYAHRYAEITRGESGKPGPLFLHFLLAFNLALACAILAVVLRWLRA